MCVLNALPKDNSAENVQVGMSDRVDFIPEMGKKRDVHHRVPPIFRTKDARVHSLFTTPFIVGEEEERVFVASVGRSIGYVDEDLDGVSKPSAYKDIYQRSSF